MKKDPNYSVKVEQAIAKKYGVETMESVAVTVVTSLGSS